MLGQTLNSTSNNRYYLSFVRCIVHFKTLVIQTNAKNVFKKTATMSLKNLSPLRSSRHLFTSRSTLLFINYLPNDKLQNTRLFKHTPASLFVAHTEISAYVYHLTKSFIIIHQVIHSVTISNSLSHHANRPEAGQTCAVQPTQFVPTTNDSRSKISAISPARQFIRNKP